MKRVDNIFPGSMETSHRIFVGKNAPKKDYPFNAFTAIVESRERDNNDLVYTCVTQVLPMPKQPWFFVSRSYTAFKAFYKTVSLCAF